MKNLLMKKLGRLIRKEIISSCSSNSNSLFACKKDLKAFNWVDLASDFKRTAPLACSLLESLVAANRSPLRSLDGSVLVGLIAGIILRNANERTNAVQRQISLVLAAGHAPKQVSLLSIIIYY